MYILTCCGSCQLRLLSHLPEDVPQFLVAQFAYPAFAACHGHVRQVFLLLDHVVDAFFKGVFGDEAVHHDVPLLPDAVGAVGSLGFHGRIPPQVVVDDV